MTAPGFRDGPVSFLDRVYEYHERSKHHFDRFALSPGFMDWSNQPDPFRRYGGASLVRFPLPDNGDAVPFRNLHLSGAIPPSPLSIESLSRFFRYALSLTARKDSGDMSWYLRANPSSGNLHPTEGYALLPAMEGIHGLAGVYHYAPKEHGLERRAEIGPESWAVLGSVLPKGSFLVALTSIYWREAWKYGERAFRYSQHDTGHAWGSLSYAAAAMGWTLLHIGQGAGHAHLLGIDRESDRAGSEHEDMEWLAAVVPRTGEDMNRLGAILEAMASLAPVRWMGNANVLSLRHGVDWPVIDDVAAATAGPIPTFQDELNNRPSYGEPFKDPADSDGPGTAMLILGRRSAVAMDGVTALEEGAFFRMMARLVPILGPRETPWDSVPWRSRIQLGLFVHRVTGLEPGLYALVRDPGRLVDLKAAMDHGFLWNRTGNCHPGLPLYLLREGDVRSLAADVSCGQRIAGDGAFSLAMLADYKGSLAVHGAPFYRNLFWECGLVGQVLYLEAEAAGVRGTGIGCFFDEPVHQAFGLKGRDWQSLYHFTVGGPVADARLQTTDPYPRSL